MGAIAKGILTSITYAGQSIAEAIDVSGDFDYVLPSDLQDWSIPLSGPWKEPIPQLTISGRISVKDFYRLIDLGIIRIDENWTD